MTTRLTDEQIEELERLEREATPGPWERWVGHGTIVAGPAKRNTRTSIGGHRAAVCVVEDDDGWDEEETEANGDADADFIPAARNALPSLLAEVRVARSSSGSGEREAIHAIRDVWLSARTNDDTPPGCYLVDSEPMLHAHGVMLRALSSAPPSPDSGERVRALEEALRESRRCGDKLAKELRGWRDTYVSDDEEDPEGWLALDGWAKSSDARDLALSPQGDGGTP